MITLTERAAREVKKIIDELNDGKKYLRIGVRGGGCSGFQYALALDDTFSAEKDTLEEQDGISIAIDKRSSLYVEGTTIDFHEDIMKRGFVFSNPNSKTTCGCGKSFSM